MQGRARPGCYDAAVSMQIVQAVFGVFHHFELAHQLRARGHLRKIYTSWPWARVKREGLPRELVGTFPYFHGTDYVLSRALHGRGLYPVLDFDPDGALECAALR